MDGMSQLFSVMPFIEGEYLFNLSVVEITAILFMYDAIYQDQTYTGLDVDFQEGELGNYDGAGVVKKYPKFEMTVSSYTHLL